MLAAARAVGAARRRALRARDHGRDERAARAARRPHGLRRQRGLRASAPSAPPDARAPVPPVRAASGAARAARALPRRRAAGLGPDGELEPLDLDSLPDVGDAEAVAVCLLFSFRDASHEQAVADGAAAPASRRARRRVARGRARVPRVRARLDDGGRRVSRARRGALSARARRGGAARRGLPEPLVMLSSGGVAPIDEAAAHPARLLVSGPAARRRRRRAPRAPGGLRGRDRLRHGRHVDRRMPAARRPRGARAERDVGGLPIRLPSVDLHTVGAGGGSLVRRDAGGAIRVGPESAGAASRACLLRRGGGATVTDANLLLGRLARGAARRARPRSRRCGGGASTGSTRPRSSTS